MSGFQLDTAGQFYVMPGHPLREIMPEQVFTWSDLSPFTQGYIEAMFASLPKTYWTQQPCLDKGNGDKAAVGFASLAPETLAGIIEDCERLCAALVGPDPFFKDAPRSDHPLASWLKQRGTERKAGAAFYRFRMGDRDAFFNAKVILITALNSLDVAARAFPPLTVTLGDDGKVHLSDQVPA